MFFRFLLVDAAVVLFFVRLVRLYSGITFGYDVSGVYYRGIRKTLRTNWADVRGIRKIRENRVWTAVDVVDDDKVSNPEGRFAYAIDSHVGPTIYIQKYFPESR